MLHSKISKLILGFTDRIVGTESVLYLLQEQRKVVIPSWDRSRIWIEHLWFKPVENGTAKERHHINDLIVIGLEILLALSEMKVTLGKEGSELHRVRTIESVRVPKV